MRKGIYYLLLLSTFLFISACQTITINEDTSIDLNNDSSKTQEKNYTTISSIEQEPKSELIETDVKQDNKDEINEENIDKKEKVVVLGIEGYEEEITFNRFENSWLRLWVEPNLHREELNQRDHIIFSENEELFFLIKRLKANHAHQAYLEMKEEMMETGYEMIETFPLENNNGTGYIYYSYEERKSIDLYMLYEGSHYVMIQFSIPELFMETYIPIFEYMLQSIEILT